MLDSLDYVSRYVFVLRGKLELSGYPYARQDCIFIFLYQWLHNIIHSTRPNTNNLNGFSDNIDCFI